MRTIKFRRAFFFDEEKTKFSHFTDWGVDINGASFTSPSSNNFALYHEDSQFTGLHDKNGKEIYEGDVVEWQTDIDRDYYGGKYGFIYEAVEFKGGSFYPVCNMDEYEFEVIGNIFENPEMLITE